MGPYWQSPQNLYSSVKYSTQRTNVLVHVKFFLHAGIQYRGKLLFLYWTRHGKPDIFYGKSEREICLFCLFVFAYIREKYLCGKCYFFILKVKDEECVFLNQRDIYI